jgi:pimeloyl-ACP methyl ester carboxylesterase
MAYSVRGGTGPALLFLHGTGCDSGDWGSTLHQLTSLAEHADVRTVLLDFRGHGRSDVPEEPFTLQDLAIDVLRLVAQLDLDEVTVVGHSLGGMVAMAAAMQSSRIASLVLLEGWTSLRAAKDAFAGARFYGNLSAEDIQAIQSKASLTQHRFAPGIWASFWRSVQEFDASTYLVQATIPILEVYGGLGRRDSTQARLQVPDRLNISWLWITDAGHYLPIERPDLVAAACLQGLRAGELRAGRTD